MSGLRLNDLHECVPLDRQAMAQVKGGGRSLWDFIHEGVTRVGEGLGTAAGWVYCKTQGPNCGGATTRK